MSSDRSFEELGETITYPTELPGWFCDVELPKDDAGEIIALTWVIATCGPSANLGCGYTAREIAQGFKEEDGIKRPVSATNGWLNKLAIIIAYNTALYNHDDKYYIIRKREKKTKFI